MFVISGFYRYRIPLILFILSLIATFSLKHTVSDSQKLVSATWEHSQQIFVDTKTNNLTLTKNVMQTVLENGLTVLTKEVHNAPVVTVQMWYKVGSVNDAPGMNGIAHQLEHMMFKGTKTRPLQFGQLFSALGSDSNAFTSYEQTAYYNTAESDKLQALLELEADRMQNLLIDNQQLISEKRVVISELQGYENSPKYRLKRAVMKSVFPNHAYGLATGGTKADVEKLTVEQLREYYQQFYNPDTAILVIVGDFPTAPTLEVVKSIFGKIPQSQKSPQITKSPTPQISASPIWLKEPGVEKLLQVIYPLPDLNHPDVPVLGVMDYVLTSGKNSYLYEVLVKSGLAIDVSAHVASLRQSGWYDLVVTAAPNQDLQKINAILKSSLEKLVKTGVTSEQVERAKTQLVASVILNGRDINSQAMQFANDQLVGGDYCYTERYLENVRQVKPNDIISVINKYLKPEAQVVGFFEPSQKDVNRDTQSSSTATSENFSAGVSVAASEVMKYLPSTIAVTNNSNRNLPQKVTLTNGLRVLLLPDQSSPTVSLSGYIKAGKEFDADDKAGLASLVADNLMNGTTTKDTLTIAKTLEVRGASLNFTAQREGVRIQGKSLREDLPVLLETMTDVVKNSTFPVNELELSRQQALNGLNADLNDADEVANRKLIQSIYPYNHPLHNFPTQESIQNINRGDVIAFKQKHYRPDTTVLTLVGDFDFEKVRSLLETQMGDWQVKGKPPILKYPTVVMTDKGVNLNSVLPGKSQAVTYMGYTGIKRQDPRFYQALVLNQILGGDTLSSRLGAEVRDRLGLTYGIYSNFQAGRNIGTFLIEMQTSPEYTYKAIARTRQLLKQLHQQGVTKLEVETAQRTLISNYNISLAKPEELTDRILMNEVYGLDEIELRSFVQKIQKVNLTEVNQAARELLNPDNIVVVTAGPAIMAKYR
ncbi:insulinase family protein [Anabaena cylindrica FACHB-243]|uniref:Processing peptidase n=1 Tax=Anabaena cylindrica (strain ATCC 27899 / PCC 7122) TaxID=272123 RepID=K9ZG32_ANACC|nr:MULTISPECIES: pitrilysin family protein [Anabaena]AFZ57547.1 processing peptidase [Anabaena cylindrica PCC 7122]MBD2418484.1 insulinase family protein [Anabaena cylindrica FACHB-243]MBY5283695.1 insulinase family protein [Anabaena sp. CCAP 1446/1C]MBY5308471.1 insulinase family protein [Anabaena sp. CCAP 1446/1C]MCM2405088.1 insulinase family protein [Anabaena sp. CCAP 1446/1C]